MKIRFIHMSFLCLVLVIAGVASCQDTSQHGKAAETSIPRMTGDGSGAFSTGHYRNLFVEVGKSPDQVRVKVERTYQQLFHGNPLSERVYFEAGSNANGVLGYMTDWANNDARTEGMSYGMMIAVQLNHKREFDALWNWSNTYMLITDLANPNVGYFAWSMNTDGSPRSAGPAPDGEEYYAMALLFAARRWGNGAGIYDYQQQAEKILRGMRHHPVLTGTGPFRIHPEDPAPFVYGEQPLVSPNETEKLQAEHNLEIELKGEGKSLPPSNPAPRGGSYQQTSGPMVEEEHSMVRFVPEGRNGITDASYHLPAFYELFARWGPAEDRVFWAKAADVSRALFARVTGASTGLSPERSNFDMSPVIGRDGQPIPFGFDSWRTVSNWSVDYSWWHKDPSEVLLSQRIQHFLIGQGMSTFADQYTLEGTPLSNRHSVGMLATTTVGGLAAEPGLDERAFVEELWRTPIPIGEQRYFDGLLYLMSLLHCSGEFRVIQNSTGREQPK